MPEVSEVDWQFHPVWDVKHEAVSSYFMSPHMRETGARVRGYQFEAMPPTKQDYLLLDVESIAASERALKRLRLQRKKVLVGISLHASSLMSERGLAMLLSKLDDCDPELLNSRLIKLAGVDSGFPRIHLGMIVGALRAGAPKVVVSAAWHETDPASLIQAGATAFGFAYPDDVASELSTYASGTLMARFKAGVDIAHAEGVPLYVEGAIGPHLAKEFRAAGADYICSPIIWTPKSEPDAMVKWPSSLLPN